MKIKLLSLLLLILAGVIVISGCVGEEAQVFTYKGPDLYRTILYPYIGLLNHDEHEMQDMRFPDSPPGEFHPDPYSMYTLRHATSLLDKNIEKAEAISVRLEDGIEHYKEEGEDVSKLEVLLEKYNRLIKEAEQYRALADAAAENSSSIENSNQYTGSSENMERDYLIQSQKCMIQANHVLRDIFEELSSLTFASEELTNTSRLISAGTGKVLLLGSFTLNLHLENGEMAIMGLSPDSEIDINGNYTFEEKNDAPDQVRLYHINSADVKVSGSSKTVMLNSENITLTADGEGYLVFQGNGTYRVEEDGRTVKEDNWPKPFFEDGMNSGEYGPDGKGNNIGQGPDGKDDDADYRPDRKDDNFGYGPDGKGNDTNQAQ
ncbi:hypothetical protein MSBRW_1418 [Methanosarcina barkeri str. Wiesmoor]|uniref:ATPase involved in DNA repair n=2 Tax=Methanosarcina barkeri TaxID=2208 RepID=A0A0E3LL53_METBA|nr:hypothetical protein [Methanosarcina barkeri]AKB50671.1 hypothetical protein MSBRW_1418 [Methanosarcina barkeri str. Wiesmoor]